MTIAREELDIIAVLDGVEMVEEGVERTEEVGVGI